MSELLPCPFCGSTDIHVYSAYGLSRACCHGCGVRNTAPTSEQQAVEWWNTRAVHPDQRRLDLVEQEQLQVEYACETWEVWDWRRIDMNMSRLDKIIWDKSTARAAIDAAEAVLSSEGGPPSGT